MKDNSELTVQNMSKKHVDDMLRLEQGSRENFWNKEIFLRHLKTPRHDGLVAVVNNVLVGFIAIEYKINSIRILNMVSSKKSSTLKVEDFLIRQVKLMISSQLNNIKFNVRESNLKLQMILKNNCFECTSIFKNYFIDNLADKINREHAYCFTFSQQDLNSTLINFNTMSFSN